MADDGLVRQVGSRILAGLGLTRKRHIHDLTGRAMQLQGKVARLERDLTAAQRQAAQGAEDLARTLRWRNAELAAALRELDFRTARWRECAERLTTGEGDPDYGFALLPPGPLGFRHDGPVHEKRSNGRPLISGLTAKQAFHLEAACLSRLQQQGGDGARHFPTPVRLDPDEHRITMSWQGTSLDVIAPPQRAARAALIRDSFRDQLRRIVQALERARVVQLDMHASGRNITVSEAGTISLIDFDMATLDDMAFSAEIARRHADWRHGGRYERTLRQLTAIVSDFLTAAEAGTEVAVRQERSALTHARDEQANAACRRPVLTQLPSVPHVRA